MLIFITTITITIFITSATNEEFWLLIGFYATLLYLKLVFTVFLSKFPFISINFNHPSLF